MNHGDEKGSLIPINEPGLAAGCREGSGQATCTSTGPRNRLDQACSQFLPTKVLVILVIPRCAIESLRTVQK